MKSNYGLFDIITKKQFSIFKNRKLFSENKYEYLALFSGNNF